MSLEDLSEFVLKFQGRNVRRCPCGRPLIARLGVVYQDSVMERRMMLVVCSEACGKQIAEIMGGDLYKVEEKDDGMGALIHVMFQCDCLGCQSPSVEKWVGTQGRGPYEDPPNGWKVVEREEMQEYGPPRFMCPPCQKAGRKLPEVPRRQEKTDVGS